MISWDDPLPLCTTLPLFVKLSKISLYRLYCSIYHVYKHLDLSPDPGDLESQGLCTLSCSLESGLEFLVIQQRLQHYQQNQDQRYWNFQWMPQGDSSQQLGPVPSLYKHWKMKGQRRIPASLLSSQETRRKRPPYPPINRPIITAETPRNLT